MTTVGMPRSSHEAEANDPRIQNSRPAQLGRPGVELHEAGAGGGEVADGDAGEHEPGGADAAAVLGEDEHHDQRQHGGDERRAGHAQARRPPPMP